MAERVPERRSSPRVAAPGEVALLGQGCQADGVLRDVSVAGIGVAVWDAKGWNLGGPVRVAVRLRDGELFEAEGWLARVEPQELGIAFEAIAPDDLEALEELVELATDDKPRE